MYLEEGMIKKFMSRMSLTLTHNINIMNEKGIIIAASRDPGRIGTFHEIAYNMLQKNIGESSTEFQTDFAGTQIGVNLLLKHDNENIGVCGVTGNPDEVYDIANLVKMSLETMVDYETQHERLQERKNLKLRFTNTLLYNEDEEQIKMLPEMAKELGYNPTALRIPLLIHFHDHSNVDVEQLRTRIKASMYINSDDILVITRNRCLMLFKTFGHMQPEDAFSGYKDIIDEFVDNLQSFILQNRYDCSFYVGCFQDRLINYAYEFKHLKWLRVHYKAPVGQLVYFYDHVGEYMTYTMPFAEVYKIFDVYTHYLPEDMKTNITETISSLEIHNYNLNTTSQEMFIHKNTLIFRFNKIKKFFGINPVQEPEDRYFASYMAFYLKNKDEHKEEA